MPLYTYHCLVCGKVFDFHSSIAERNILKICDCGNKAERDEATELRTSGDTSVMMSHERASYAMGVNLRQIPQAVKLYPGSEYDSKGRLIIHSRKHKLFEMRRRGMTEFE